MFKAKALFYSILAGLTLPAGLLAQANRIFAFPSGVDPNVTVLDATTLARMGTVVASGNAFQALSAPDGSKYYIVANNVTRTLTIVSASNLSAPRYVDLGTNASAATLTPDGRRLLILAGRLKVFDTATDTQVADVDVGPGPSEIEVTNDSARAYVLAAGGIVSVVNLAASPPARTAQISVGGAFSIALRPDNKSVLVAGAAGLAIINSRTNSVATTIPVPNFSSGKVLVTPDSSRAVTVNRGLAPFNTSQVVNLASQSLTQIGPANQAFERIVILDDATAFGSVTGSNAVARIDLATGASTLQSYGQNTRSIDVAPNGKTVYLASFQGGSVTRVDVVSNTATPQSVTPAPVGLSAVFPPPTSGAASLALIGGDNQNVIAGRTVDIPLSVKVTNSDGSPVFNVPVSFSTSAPGVTFTPTQPSRSGLRGIAQALVTLPAPRSSLRDEGISAAASSEGAVEQGIEVITVTASVPGLAAVNFTLTVGSGTGIIIISGDFQIARPFTPFPFPLRVLVTDLNGNSLPAGTLVSFFGGAGVFPPAVLTTTDADGFAQAQFQGGTIPPTLISIQTQVAVVAEGVNSAAVFTLTAAYNVPSFCQPTDPAPCPGGPALGDGQSGEVGTTLPIPLTIQLQNTFGPVGPVVVFWQVIDGPAGAGSASLNPPASVAIGFAQTVVTLGPRPGTIRIRATSSGLPGSVTFTVFATGGPPSRIEILQGDNQEGRPGNVLPFALRFRVFRADGSPLPLPSALFPVNFTLEPTGAATVFNFFQQIDGEGSVLVRLGNTPGPFRLIVASGTATATFNLRVAVTAATMRVSSGNNQRVPLGATSGNIVVRVEDVQGSGSPGVPVTITAPGTVTLVPAQGASGNPLTITTGADGTVTFAVRAGPGTPFGQLNLTASFSVGGVTGSVGIVVFVDGRRPTFTQASVVNAASFVAGIVPYGLSTLFGTGLSEISGIEFPAGVTSYKGVTIRIDGTLVPLYLVRNEGGQEQINFQTRSDLPAGVRVRVEVTNNGSTTTVEGVEVRAAQPGIFEYTPQGSSLRYAAAVKLDGSVVGPDNPVPRGAVLLVFFTGGGVTLPILPAGQPGPANPPAVTFLQPLVGIANRGAEVLFSGLTPGFVGLYQINVRVPEDAPVSSNVSLVIVMEGQSSQDSRIAVGP